MSGRETRGQNEATTSQDVIDSKQAAVGGTVSSSSSSCGGIGGGGGGIIPESRLIQQLISPVKAGNMGSNEGELVRLTDPRSLHSYTPHTSPVPSTQGTSAVVEVTPNTTPSSSPRRPPPCLLSQPPAKRIKVEEKPTDIMELRKVIIDWKKAKLEVVKEKYNDHLVELFFLERDGNMMDFQAWSRRPSREFLQYISRHKLEGDESLEARFTIPNPLHIASGLQIKTESLSGPQSPLKSALTSHTRTSLSPVKPGKGLTSSLTLPRQKMSSMSEGIQTSIQQDQMVEKARQEAYVMQRVASLRKEGLWTEKRLPKVQEPPRPKAHWDYLLEEMVWLSADFAQERKWKKAAAKKCARMVQKYFQDKALQVQKAEKEQEMRLRKVAAFIAKEIRTFWGNVEKLVEFKVTTKLDEKKKKALDQQLSFIVDQTEKYSSWLAESMNKPLDSTAASTRSNSPSRDSGMSDKEFQPEESSEDDEETIAREDDNPEEQASELQLLHKESKQTMEDLLKDLPPGFLEDADFSQGNSSDDETLAAESQETPEEGDSAKSKDVPAEEPDGEKPNSNNDSLSEGKSAKRKRTPIKVESKSDSEKDVDDDFEANVSDEDDENTIEQQEEEEGDVNHELELQELEAENEMSVEELRKKYEALAAAAEPMEEDGSEDDSDDDDEDEEEMEVDQDDEEKQESEKEEDSDDECLTSEDENMEEAEVEEEEDPSPGLETLMEDNLDETSKGDSEKVDKELQDASAVAEALQPKGFTLSSTSVTTPVPFLLKHMLREYQHVGLDWLTTMYEKKLNGTLVVLFLLFDIITQSGSKMGNVWKSSATRCLSLLTDSRP